MKRFEFRLDPVIRYRQYVERLALMELAREKQALLQVERRIEELEQTRKDVVRDLAFLQAEGMGVGRYRTYMAYLEGLSDEIEAQNTRLVEIGRNVTEKHQAAEAERIKKETLECVRQKEYTEYVHGIEQAEQKEADELVSLRRGSGRFLGV